MAQTILEVKLGTKFIEVKEEPIKEEKKEEKKK